MYNKQKICLNFRRSHQSCSIEKAVLKNFAIFTKKHLRWSLFLIELQVSLLIPAIVLKETPTMVFFCEYCENFKSTCFQKKLQATASAVPASYCEYFFLKGFLPLLVLYRSSLLGPL